MTPFRQRVTRADGRTINVVQRRGHLSYCHGACCCGRTDRGYAPVPVELYKEEWLKRKAFDLAMREFLERSNPWALHAIAKRLLEAADRGLWEHPSDEALARLKETVFDSETMLEAREERGAEAL